MTIGDVEREAREIILDTYEDSYRFSYSEVFTEIGNAIKRLNSVRPESKYVDMRLASYNFPVIKQAMTPIEITTLRETKLNVEDRWLEALVYYVVHKLYKRDDSDTVNVQLAENYYREFERIALS